ncbi:hypothetical protein VTP01DRAFT_1266 [Rhizomucor pusillus]|uniref:uncharacterized protein n=1 Tax=Rhizomucor pusillus TaxID=4840 RepID=UPI00374405B3
MSAAAPSPSRQAVLSAYRNLLKTQREVFGGDYRAIQAARKETHARFMQYKDEQNVDVLEEKLKMAEQVATLLKRNVVQGVAEEDKPDVFSMLLSGAYEPKRP